MSTCTLWNKTTKQYLAWCSVRACTIFSFSLPLLSGGSAFRNFNSRSRLRPLTHDIANIGHILQVSITALAYSVKKVYRYIALFNSHFHLSSSAAVYLQCVCVKYSARYRVNVSWRTHGWMHAWTTGKNHYASSHSTSGRGTKKFTAFISVP